MKLTKLYFRAGAALLVALAMPFGLAQKPGDLVVTPTRLTLDAKGRAGDLTLVNKGTQPIRYRLRFVDMDMSESGVLKRSIERTPNSGIEFFRLSPREILLQPGEFQRIKVLANFPAGAKEGEYRSHLAFEPIQMPRPTLAGTGSSDGISLNLELRSVVTIPVIARNGTLSATGGLSNPQLSNDRNGWFVAFDLTRTGNRTLRGDAVIQFVPDNGGKSTTLGEISGLPIYYPNTVRRVTVRIAGSFLTLGKGKIEARFIDSERPKNAPPLRLLIAIAD